MAGRPDSRNNVRRRLLHPAIKGANVTLRELGIEPIGNVSPHGLRRTYASLRSAVGDDPAFTSAQLGHEDPTFTLRVYTHAVKRRQRLTGNELAEFNRALEWVHRAQMGTSEGLSLIDVAQSADGKSLDPARQAETN